jgi:hypothetical protein
MHDRRMFLHTGAALAVPLLGGAFIRRQSDVGPQSCTECADDPVSKEALRQFKLAVRSLTKSAKGEHARNAGAALRIIAAHAAARNLDAEFRRVVTRDVRIYGRDNVLMRPFDRDQFVRTARELGVDPAPELLTNATLAQKRQALDTLVSVGIAAHMERAAAFFEAAGTSLDARGPVQLVQLTKEEQIAICKGQKDFLFQSEIMMIAACLFMGVVACAYFSGVYVGARYYYDYQTDCAKWLG